MSHLPRYEEIISQPMDLSTITRKLTTNEYKSQGEVAEDIRLMCRNAMKYTPRPDAEVYKCAQTLLDKFEEWYAEFQRIQQAP